jgi:uncharacterized protein
MGFQYDPAKAAENVRKHGVSFADAEGVFHDPLALTVEDVDARYTLRRDDVRLSRRVARP